MQLKEHLYSVYIVKCNDGSLYTGISNNVAKRISTHNKGKGAKYTRARLPVILMWTNEVGTRSDALKEEYRIKKLSRQNKFKIFN